MFSVPRSVKSGPERHRRRRKFIDQGLQGRLMLALITLELTMLVVGIGYLWWAFSNHVEAALFTIHRSAQGALLHAFLSELALVVVVMGAVNTLALLLAHRLWLRHIRSVISEFRRRLLRIRQLDLTPVPGPAAVHHEVLALLEAWRRQEAQRAARIDRLLARLPWPVGEKDRRALEQLFHELDEAIRNVR